MLTLSVNLRWRRLCALVLSLGLLAGCAQAPDLLAFGGALGRDVDLTGAWIRHVNDGTQPADPPPLVLGESLPPELERRRVRSRNRRGSNGPSAALLLDGLYVSARKLRVTQEPTALFVKFDLSRVREYRYGEKRDANVGSISVLRVSGWEDDQYLIKSLTDDGTLIEERYFLADRGLRLIRRISISKGEAPPRELEQTFTRDTSS